MDSDPVADQSRQRLAEPGAEPEGADPVRDRVLVDLLRRVPQQVGGVLDGRGLREVDDVHRVLAGGDQFLERVVQRLDGPAEAQRHRPLGIVDDRRVAPGARLQVVHEERHVAEGRRHQQELGVDELQQRHLPRPAAVVLRVEVELVHHHEPDVGRATLTQRDVGQHLGGAADDRRVGVDRRVAGQHADVVGAEDLDEGEELLADERLDRGGVEAHLVTGERRDVGADGDQRLPRPGRRREHDMVATEQLDDRLVLVRVKVQPPVGDPAGEGVVDRVRVRARRDPRVEAHWIRHASIQPPTGFSASCGVEPW